MKSLRMLVAGDFCVRGASELLMSDDAKIREIAAPVRKLTDEADISMVNVETLFTDRDTPITKSGPNLKSSIKSLDLLRAFSFDVAAGANNHSGDFGEEALLESLERLRESGMLIVGAGKDEKDAQKILYIEKNGMKVAILNYAEHEFGTAEKDKAGTAAMDYYQNTLAVREAKKNADAVIVYYHGGNEYNPLPRPGMKKLCRTIADAGATAVIVCHSHCPQGYEMHGKVPIIYGTGNFYFGRFNLNAHLWCNGYLVDLTITEQGATFTPVPFEFDGDGSYWRLLEGEKKESFLAYLSFISELIHNEPLAEKLWLAWCDIYVSNHQEWFNDIRLVGKAVDSTAYVVRNVFTCESHNELMTTYQRAFCDGKLTGLEPYKEMIYTMQKGLIPTI